MPSLLWLTFPPFLFSFVPADDDDDQFVLKVCDDPELGFDASALGVDEEGLLDDACGAGTSEMDFTAEDYESTIEGAVDLLEGFVRLSIPEDQIGELCEVCGLLVRCSMSGAQRYVIAGSSWTPSA